MLAAIFLIELTGAIFISVGGSHKQRRKYLEKTCGELARGSSIIQAARAARIPALGLERTLTYVIDHGYLKNASLQNNTLRFGTKWPG